jgi:hypothetical protein
MKKCPIHKKKLSVDYGIDPFGPQPKAGFIFAKCDGGRMIDDSCDFKIEVPR